MDRLPRTSEEPPRSSGGCAVLQCNYIADYFDDIAAQVSGVTARDYGYAIDKHLLAFFGNRRLNEISTAVVKCFQTKLNRSGYALATVNDYVTARRRSIAVSTRYRDHFHRTGSIRAAAADRRLKNPGHW